MYYLLQTYVCLTSATIINPLMMHRSIEMYVAGYVMCRTTYVLNPQDPWKVLTVD